jgi:predicted ATP-binding protein involved in virulence
MAIRPPKRPFRVEEIEVVQVPAKHLEPEPEPIIQTKIEVVEVEKIIEKVIYKDDPDLLKRLNDAYKELGEARAKIQAQAVNNQSVVTPLLVQQDEAELKLEEETQVAAYETLNKNKMRELMLALIAFIAGVVICYATLR